MDSDNIGHTALVDSDKTGLRPLCILIIIMAQIATAAQCKIERKAAEKRKALILQVDIALLVVSSSKARRMDLPSMYSFQCCQMFVIYLRLTFCFVDSVFYFGF